MSKFKKTLLLTMLLAVFAPLSANAQNTVKATCDAITTLPWEENFDEYTGSDPYPAPSTYPNDPLPDGWNFINRSETTSTYPQAYICNSTDYAVSGNCLFFRSSRTTPLYAVLPQFSNHIKDLKLSFTYRNYGTSTNNGTLYVSYMTNPNDASTFNEEAAIACDITTIKTTMDVVFNNAPDGSYFAFKYQGGSADDYYLSIDNVTVKERVVVVANQIVASNPGLDQMTWDQFAQHVNDGAEFPFEIYLMEDITVNTMAGTEDNPFTGTFNGTFMGNSHTITVSLTATDDNFTAPFRVIKNANIKYLMVTGTINDGGHKFCAGFAGDCYGNNTFTNCVSDVTINATINGDGTHGGFIARNQGGSRTESHLCTTTFEGCAFTGKLHGESTNHCGGFCGWSEYDRNSYNYARTTFNNCVFAPQDVTMNTTQCATFARGRDLSFVTFNNNCYFMQDFNNGTNNTDQGKHAYGITGIGGVTVAISENSYDYYNVSDIGVYTTGIIYNGNLYAAEGDNMNLLLSRPGYLVIAYSASEGTLSGDTPTGTNDEYTLTMPSEDVTISATAYINSIATAANWEEFCTTVNGGYDYSGKTVTMTGNVGTAGSPVTTMVGDPSGDKCFSGIFDGGGYTLTFSKTVSEQYCAPFRRINNATIQNLKTAGQVTMNNVEQRFLAGIVAYTKGSSFITNCVSSMAIRHNRNGDSGSGGIVGQIGNGSTCTISGCVFNGTMEGANSTYWGGIVGYIRENTTASISNCLFAPQSITIGSDCSTFATVRGGSPSLEFINCYYNDKAASMNTKQGKQAYTITGDSPVDVAMSGIPTSYSTSGITAYSDNSGMLYNNDNNENIYAGEGEAVSLNLDIIVPLGYDVNYEPSEGNLIGSANLYTLTMPAANVIITATITTTDWSEHASGDDWDNAYLIYNKGQLDLLATRVNSGTDYSNKYFKVMDNITYTGNSNNYTAIGDANSLRFNGHFDGQGYTVSGINARTTNSYNGLFGYLDSGAEVKNVVLSNTTIDDGSVAGGIAGENEGTVTNCHVTSTVTMVGADQNSSLIHGGIVGINCGSVSQCTFAGTLTKNFSSSLAIYYYGGIAGQNNRVSQTIIGTMSDNLVIGATIPSTGNLYGAIAGNSSGTLARNYYVNCTVAGVENATDVGCHNADVTYNDGAMPGNVRTVEAPTVWSTDDPDVLVNGWAFIASPLTADADPALVDNLISSTSGYDLYRLNPSTSKWENWKIGAGNNADPGFSLDNGRGYLYATQTGQTVKFLGTDASTYNLNDTTVVALGKGFNLVGNPFPRAAYINKPYYTLNETGSAVTVSLSTATPISPCHGVVVEIVAEDLTNETNTVTFTTTAPTQQNATNNGNIQLALTQAVATRGGAETKTLDNAIVSFNEDDELGKFYFGEQNANIYIPQDNEEYAIAYSDKQGEMPLNFKATKDGEYSLNVNPENVEMSYLHLIDNMTGADIDLLAANGGDAMNRVSTYTFNATTTDYESRFKLVFSANTEDGPSTGSGTFAFYSNGNWIIANEGEATLQVVDLMGRILSSETINGSVSKAINTVPGVYMIRLINGENVKVQKVVIE